MTRAIRAIVAKDAREIFGHWQVAVPMILLPLILCVAMPLLVFSGVDRAAGGDLSQIVSRMPAATLATLKLPSQIVFQAALDYLFPILFLFIPVIAASILGAASFVGEKERGTLETLFYTPVSLRRLFLAKVLAVFAPAYGVSLVAFAAFGAVVNWKAAALYGAWVFPNAKWLAVIFCLSPALALFAIALMVLISARASTFQAAQQLSAIVVLPVVGLLSAQTSGAIMLETLLVVRAGLVLLAVDGLLLGLAARAFRYETMLK